MPSSLRTKVTGCLYTCMHVLPSVVCSSVISGSLVIGYVWGTGGVVVIAYIGHIQSLLSYVHV